MTTHTTERLIGTKEVAARYGVHPKTVAKLVKRGRIPKPIREPFGRGDFWRESIVDAHLRSLEAKETESAA